MNIIKFKDNIKLHDDIFNTYLKGKYAYWVHCRYVIPLDYISIEEYIKYEADIQIMLNRRNDGKHKFYWDLHKEGAYLEYVDKEGTEEAMDLGKYVRHNSFACDDNITIEELKVFRKWLVQSLRSFDISCTGKPLYKLFDDNFIHVLDYYENNMFDDTVKWLSKYGDSQTILAPSTSGTACGCVGKLEMPVIENACNPVYIYRRNIYMAMVEKFGETDFWSQFSDAFLLEFKQYIDNILRMHLPLAKTEYVTVLAECSCMENSYQVQAETILANLSQSIQYMIEDQTMGHVNFIQRSFQEWARQLFEMMYWK